MTTPTPPIELTGTGAHLAVRARGRGRRRRARCAVGGVPDRRPHLDVRAEASRDWWPLAMHWALAGEAPAIAAVVARPTHRRARCRGSSPSCHARAASRSPRPAAAAACAARPSRCSAACCSTRPGSSARRQVDQLDRPESGVVEVWAGTFGPDLERRARRARPVASGTSRRASTSPPSAAGSPAAAPASTAPATARSRTSSSASRSCSPTARSCAPAARRRPRSAPTSPSCSSAARARSASSPACWLRTHPMPPAERREAVVVRRLRRPGSSCAGDPPPRRDAGGAAALRRRREPARPGRRRQRVHRARARRGRPGARRRDVRGGRCRCAPSWRRTPLGPERVERWMAAPQRHLGAAGAHAEGVRGRHDGDRRAVVGAAADLRRGPRGDARRAARPRRDLPPLAQLPGRRVPVLHVRRHPTAGRPGAIERTYVAMWDAGQRAVLAAGGNLSHHHGVGLEPQPVRRRGARERRSRCSPR